MKRSNADRGVTQCNQKKYRGDVAVNRTKPGWLAWLQHAPKHALGLLQGKAQTLAHSLQEAPSAQRLAVNREALARVRNAAKLALAASAAAIPAAEPSSAEQAMLQRIRTETAALGRNNVTRTAAYWAFYEAIPELHWAFLAHLVSRNGGWAMTDLKGELLPRLLGDNQREAIFRFLERANSLIFHDAYAQLLLYRESMRTGYSFTHLLPQLGVSAFMRPVWDEFARSRDSALLTAALIVNEQHFIEARVVQNGYFKRHVLDTFAFKTQAALQLNQVVFPYDTVSGGARTRLAGLILEDFGRLRERISVGQKLYAILFGLPDVRAGAHVFARRRPHTGSRSDYCPELFAPVRRGSPEPVYRPKLDGTQLAEGAAPLFSPRLEHAWKDRNVEPPEPGDWFRDDSALSLLPEAMEPPFSFDMTEEFKFGLSKIELAILTAQELGNKP